MSTEIKRKLSSLEEASAPTPNQQSKLDTYMGGSKRGVTVINNPDIDVVCLLQSQCKGGNESSPVQAKRPRLTDKKKENDPKALEKDPFTARGKDEFNKGKANSQKKSTMPLPNFSAMRRFSIPAPTEASSSPPRLRYDPPATPMRKRALSGPALEFSKLHSKLCSGILEYRGERYTVALIEGAKGDYLQAYEVTGDKPLIEGYRNEDILIKTFHERRINKSPRLLEKYMEHSLTQYHDLLNKVPVAKFLNSPVNNKLQPITDRFYIVEKIPNAIDTSPWNNHQTIEELPNNILIQLKSVRQLFNYRIKTKIEIDLLPQNIRANNLNEIYLIDFIEEEDEQGKLFLGSLTQALELWSQGNRNILDYLTADFAEIDSQIASEVQLYFKRAD